MIIFFNMLLIKKVFIHKEHEGWVIAFSDFFGHASNVQVKFRYGFITVFNIGAPMVIHEINSLEAISLIY